MGDSLPDLDKYWTNPLQILYDTCMADPRINSVDRDLVVRISAGEVAAFEAAYDRHSAQAFALALRITGRRRAAEEVTQDAFVSLWRAAPSYDAGRGALSTWLLSMVRNRSIDWLRREARHSRDLELDDARVEQVQADGQMEEDLADREESGRARQFLAGLPSEQRQVIELAYFKGLSQTEVAAAVRIPLGTVKGRQRLALAKLRRVLAGPSEPALTG
jgi:RNA polymerase sigma-70 factor (ECF subfamily)